MPALQYLVPNSINGATCHIQIRISFEQCAQYAACIIVRGELIRMYMPLLLTTAGVIHSAHHRRIAHHAQIDRAFPAIGRAVTFDKTYPVIQIKTIQPRYHAHLRRGGFKLKTQRVKIEQRRIRQCVIRQRRFAVKITRMLVGRRKSRAIHPQRRIQLAHATIFQLPDQIIQTLDHKLRIARALEQQRRIQSAI